MWYSVILGPSTTVRCPSIEPKIGLVRTDLTQSPPPLLYLLFPMDSNSESSFVSPTFYHLKMKFDYYHYFVVYEYLSYNKAVLQCIPLSSGDMSTSASNPAWLTSLSELNTMSRPKPTQLTSLWKGHNVPHSTLRGGLLRSKEDGSPVTWYKDEKKSQLYKQEMIK